jgi:DnaJ family protein C protein 13
MRSERLVAQLRAHVGDLSRKLQQHSKYVYEYTPIPPIGYPELDAEVWCHRYYLRNLCDIERFPGWPIQDRIELLQQALQMWRAELVREPGGMTFEYAHEAMQLEKHGVASGEMPTEAQMKKAYRHLARLYHPDKNPEGREKFIEVQSAFEWLSDKLRNSVEDEIGDGPRPWRLLLFVRAQCILFARCARALAPLSMPDTLSYWTRSSGHLRARGLG